MPGVREVVDSDLEPVLRLLRQLHANSILAPHPIDEAKSARFIHDAIRRDDLFCACYESASGQLDGIFIGYVAEYFFSRDKGAWDLVYYVRPQQRGGVIAFRLLRRFLQWARSAGAETIWMGTAAGIDSLKVRDFYLKLGMEQVGGIYRLGLPGPPPGPRDAGSASASKAEA